jgi:hypothetical protein
MNIFARITSYIMLGVLVLTTGVSVVRAQVFADVTFKLYPEFPRVGDQVTASVESSEVNLDFQEINWYINNKKVVSGTGVTSTLFTIDPDITTYTVRAVIGGGISGQLVRERVITPGEVILLWEAVDSYAPFWYKGKSLMPAEGTVRVTAIPVGADTLDKLFFVWKQGANSLGSLSGYAKNTIVLRNNVLLDSLDVSVQVSSANGGYQATGALSIPRTEPDVRLWSPRIGQESLYEQSGILKVFGSSATIEALPYGIAGGSSVRGLTYDWLFNTIPYIHATSEPDYSAYIASSPAPIQTTLTVQSINHLLQDVTVNKRILFER